MSSTSSPIQSTNLPTRLTPLIGREREMAALVDLLRWDDVRLLTLTGPSGVGKTRLALETAANVAHAYPNGVCFVSLAPITDPDLVLPTVARVLGVRGAADEPLAERLGAFLRDKRLLLVLDNFEQVVETAPFVAELLVACSNLTCLVTSRVRLRVSGEREHAVPPLGLLAPVDAPTVEAAINSEAVRLFLARAHAVKDDFALTDQNVSAVAEICRRLDGLPLAIELAAVRTKVLPPATLLTRLERRLPLLTGGLRDLPARQQTMHDAISWSYDLLAPQEQALFRQLGVFGGGFSLDAAAAITTPLGGIDIALIDGIGALVDKSLLKQEVGPDGEPRFGMLETIREYAQERLEESGEALANRGRHAAWCLTLAEDGFTALVRGTTIEPRWLSKLEAEHDNLRAALTWLQRTGDVEQSLQLAGALGPFWFFRSHRAEGRHWLEQALRASADTTTTSRARVLTGLGVFLVEAGDCGRAAVLLEESLAISQAMGTSWDTAEAQLLLGWLAEEDGRYAQATMHLVETLAAFRDLGADWWVAKACYHLGTTASKQGNGVQASAYLSEALTRYRELEDPWGVGIAARALAVVACEQGDLAMAATLYGESLPLWREVGAKEGLVGWLAEVASLAADSGRFENAAHLFGAVSALRDTIGDAFVLPERTRIERAEQAVRTSLGGVRFAAAEAAGRALPLNESLTEASLVVDVIATGAAGDDADGSPTLARLTRRERQVLGLLVDGSTDREIAAVLSISPRTVGHHVGSILTKLGAETRRGARAYALQHGLLPPPISKTR